MSVDGSEPIAQSGAMYAPALAGFRIVRKLDAR